MRPSGRKQLRGNILEGFELQRVARWVQEEHGGLLPGLPLEANVGLDDELDLERAHTLRQGIPVVHLQHNAAMRHWNAVAVHRIEVRGDSPVLAEVRVEMTDELMAVEVE